MRKGADVHVSYLDEYVLEDGIQRFMLPKPYTFVCTIGRTHAVESEIVFLSDRREGTFVFCPKHSEFIDVSAPSDFDGHFELGGENNHD